MKILIDLTEEKNEALKISCARIGITRAEAIRRAVDYWLATEAPVSARDGIASMFGALIPEAREAVGRAVISELVQAKAEGGKELDVRPNVSRAKRNSGLKEALGGEAAMGVSVAAGGEALAVVADIPEAGDAAPSTIKVEVQESKIPYEKRGEKSSSVAQSVEDRLSEEWNRFVSELL